MEFLDRFNGIGQLYAVSDPAKLASAIEAPGDDNTWDLEPTVPGWYSGQWETKRALLGEEYQPQIINSSTPIFQYRYLLWLNKNVDRFIVLSTQSDLVNQFAVHYLSNQKTSKPTVNVEKLVKDLARGESPYRIGAVWANVDGYGESLQSISIFGKDLVDAELFRSILPRISPYRVVLRDLRSGKEVISIGISGEIGFYYGGPRTLKNVDSALKFLRDGSYIHWTDRTPSPAE
ncbi:MAG: hypothetical protein IV101_07945 [Dechloromonas sp.]|nr:hypothetical protein [Dechloromonas sp.]